MKGVPPGTTPQTRVRRATCALPLTVNAPEREDRDVTHDGIRTNRLRRLQRNRCYLCGGEFQAPIPKGTPDRRRLNREGHPTLDHVWPKSAGHGLYRNKLLTHAPCNARKGDRAPRSCEVLYLESIHFRALAA